MTKLKRGYGNCPECRLSVTTLKNGITPRHGHIKTKAGNSWTGRAGWLPACKGSGKPAIHVRWYVHKDKKP